MVKVHSMYTKMLELLVVYDYQVLHATGAAIRTAKKLRLSKFCRTRMNTCNNTAPQLGHKVRK